MFKTAVISILFCLGTVTFAQAADNSFASSQNASAMGPQSSSTYFDWGMAVNGYGYCYQFLSLDGEVLNGGAPVADFYCERQNPSYFSWNRGVDGYVYCYQMTPYGVPMNQGRPVPNFYCGGR